MCRFTSYFQRVNRTMCPHNVTEDAEYDDDNALLDGGEAEEAAAHFLFFVDVFSSSLEPVSYSLEVEIVKDFFLE